MLRSGEVREMVEGAARAGSQVEREAQLLQVLVPT